MMEQSLPNETSRRCVVCGSAEAECYSKPIDYISKESFDVVRCVRCGLVYVDPQPSISELARYYPAGHQQAEPAAYERMDARARIRLVEGVLDGRRGRALDVGCGKGLLLMELRQRGWEVAGTELSQVSSSYARSQGLSVQTCAVEDAGFAREEFDLISMFHVLEHLPDPSRTLDSLYSLLKPDGVLLVEVPNIGSWYAKVFGDDWFHYDVPRHLYHFDSQTLTQLLAKHNFVVTERHTRNIQYDAFGAVQSLLNRRLKNPNLLNNFNTKQIVFRDLWQNDGRWKLLAQLSVSELALALGFPVFAVIALASPGEGGTLRFVARKGG